MELAPVYDFEFTPTFIFFDGEGHELWRMVGEFDDVDSLATEFLHDALNTDALLTHAGSDRIHVGIAGGDGHLCPDTRLA